MKNLLHFIITLISLTCFAQNNSINYKALVKDINGNVIANDIISVQFTIYEGSSLTNNVYQETHTPTTNDNGLFIVNIGQGSTSDIFSDINWGNDTHFLNVQINTGTGLVDLGTTQFMAVPYAITAEKASNVTGLEALDEGNGIGWRLLGKDPNNYGDIGEFAVDLSTDPDALGFKGATGKHSLASGRGTVASGYSSTALGDFNDATGYASTATGITTTASGFASTSFGDFTTASGYASTAMGFSTSASGETSLAIGDDTAAAGNSSTAMGRFTVAESFVETTIGAFNILYSENSTTEWNSSDRLFVIGNGLSSANRSNAMTVLKNGNMGLGNVTEPEEQLHLNGDIRINNVVLSGYPSGTFVIGDSSIQNIGFYSSANEWGVANNNSIKLGSSGFRWSEIWSVNPLNTSSDRRLKKDINPIPYGLDAITNLKPVSYKWKKGRQDTKLGFIAQDVESIIPEIVKLEKTSAAQKEAFKNEGRQVSNEDYYAMSYTELIPVLVKAIQELKTENDNLKQRVEQLENQ